MTAQETNFIADGMLGKLSRWLRILGCDIQYIPDAPDGALLEATEKSGRTLLTSDIQLNRLAAKQRIESYLVDGSSEAENLAKIARRFSVKLEVDLTATRCPLCNSTLREVPYEAVEGRVPPASFRRYKRFWICRNSKCDKIYWQGSHWRKIKEILKEAKKYSFQE